MKMKMENMTLLQGADKALLKTMVEMLQDDEKAMIRLSTEGLVLGMNPFAKKIFNIPKMKPFIQALSPANRGAMQKCLQNGEPCEFVENFWGVGQCDFTCRPTKEGGLLLVQPQKKLTRIDVKMQKTVRDSLQGIISSAYMLGKMEPFADELEKKEAHYERILRRTRRIERELDHVKSLLQAYMPTKFAPGDLSKLCRTAGAYLQKRCGTAVKVDVPEYLSATFDRSIVMSALMNLLANAAKAEHVTIRAGHVEGFYLIIVEDSGERFAPERLQELNDGWKKLALEETQILSSDTEAYCGLGLPYVCLAAKCHKGKLTLEESAEGWNRFVFSIADDLGRAEFMSMYARDEYDAADDERIMQVELSMME